MNRHELRVKVVTTLYQHFCVNGDLETLFEENFKDIDNEFLNSLKNEILTNKDAYIEEISSHLYRWSFSRLNFVDQAILLEAYSELKAGLNNKNIIIDEAIRIAKQYSDEDSYKYINGVLDNL